MQRHHALFGTCRARQRGGAALAVIAGLLVVAASTMAIRMARQVESRTEQQQLTQKRMERVRAALHAHAASQGRLPCPADGALDTGLAAPAAAAVNCTRRDGTVPWVSLGLQAEDAQDGWGRKISYRVPDGSNGLTRPSGVGSAGSMGLDVQDGATLLKDQAWVLISHGASGLGAWRGAVVPPRMAMPGAGGKEWSNTQAPSVKYFRHEEAVVNPGTGNEYTLNDIAHFDDVVLFESIAVLEKQSALEPLVVRLTQERLTTGNLSPVNFTDRNSSESSITFDSGTRLGHITVTAGGSGTVSVNADGSAIGVCLGACTTDAESALDNSKSLAFKLSGAKTADKFALGVLSLDPAVEVSITYLRSNPPPMPLTNLGTVDFPIPPALPLSATPGVIAVFENTQPNPPAAFDEVVIRPKGTSRFFIASIRFCTAAENCN